MIRAVVLAAMIATPAAGQVATFTTTATPGPIEFVVSDPGVLIASTGDAMTGRWTAVAAPGVVYAVIRGWELDVAFFEPDGTFHGDEANIDIGDVVHVCGFVTVDGERVAVERECGCIAPELPTVPPGLMSWSIEDPTIATLSDTPLCPIASND